MSVAHTIDGAPSRNRLGDVVCVRSRRAASRISSRTASHVHAGRSCLPRGARESQTFQHLQFADRGGDRDVHHPDARQRVQGDAETRRDRLRTFLRDSRRRVCAAARETAPTCIRRRRNRGDTLSFDSASRTGYERAHRCHADLPQSVVGRDRFPGGTGCHCETVVDPLARPRTQRSGPGLDGRDGTPG